MSTAAASGRAFAAIAAAFLLFGLAGGIWFVHIPIVTGRLGLTPPILGAVLLTGGIGGLVAQVLAAGIVGRFGARRTAMALLPALVAGFATLVFSWSIPALFALMFAVGVVGGGLNVAINTQASEYEAARGRATLSIFHGFFSVGGLAAAGIGSALIAAGLGRGSGAALAGCAMLVVAAWAGANLPPDAGTLRPAAARPRFAFPASPALLALAALAFLGNTVDGTVNNWSALYLATVKGAGATGAAAGFACFSLAMAVCRFAGGAAVDRFGPGRIVAGGGALVALGIAWVIFAPWPMLSAGGFLVVGIGAANTLPVLIGVASRAPGASPGTGVAAATSGATLGFLLGPPLVGLIAGRFGLSVGLAVIATAGAVVAVGASARSWPPR